MKTFWRLSAPKVRKAAFFCLSTKNNDMETKMIMSYEAPQIEVIVVEVEKGFAVSDFEYDNL